MRTNIPLTFQVGHAPCLNDFPETFVPATVPGAVQLDWAAAHDWPPHWYADNFTAYAWMEDEYWRYQATLPEIQQPEQARLFFVCGGVDYQFEVRFNNECLYAYEGMFTPFELDLTDIYTPGALLEVIVYPAPKSTDVRDRTQANQSAKPAVCYEWDWHPRLVTLGIWEDTFLQIRSQTHIAQSETLYTLNADLSQAEVSLQATLASPSGKAQWVLSAPSGAEVFRREITLAADTTELCLSAPVTEPELWWPNGYGAQPLYVSRLCLLDDHGNLLDEASSRIGFRTVSLEMYPGAWQQPDYFPKTRSDPPITLTVNHQAIFGKGSNWVHPDIFPGRFTEELYRSQVQYAKDAHFNLFRIWGGGIVNKQSFFDACDEMGIMVWQEFPLACNDYEGTPEYLKVLDAESKSIIRRLRAHASLAIWCGGNELFNGWSGMTEQSAALRLLNRNCYDMDPKRPFLYTSPLMNMAHGCYVFKYGDGREIFQVMPASSYTAYTEFGIPSPSSEALLKSFLPPEELFPPKDGTNWTTHHAYHAWDGANDQTWLCPNTLEGYFGPPKTLGDLVYQGQWLQCEGYKCIYEEARRQKPKCSMAVNWCYQEPWPSAANNNLISWPNTPKPALKAVADSCRPQLASARLPKFSWQPDERFTAELWILNDQYETITPALVEAVVEINGECHSVLEWNCPAVPANTNAQGPTLSFVLPDTDEDHFILHVKVKGREDMASAYRMHIHRKATVAKEETSVGLSIQVDA